MIAFNLDALQGYLAACKEWKNPALLVVGHTAPDGDAVVSSLLEAFRRHLTDGVQAVPVVQAASLPRECAWLLGDIAPLAPTRERLARHPDTPLVLTDHFEEPRYPHRVVAVVDHHNPGPDTDFTGVDTTIKKVGATTTLVTLACRRDGLVPDPAVARILLGAILLDTDGLNPAKTHGEDREAVAWLAALCSEDVDAFYRALRAQLLSEEDPAVLYARDYRLYADRQGAPLLGFAILKVWDTALPDTAAVKTLLEQDVKESGCRVCLAKISAYTGDGRLTERYLAAGERTAVAAVLEAVLTAGGEQARSTADGVFLPAEAVHRGRKWLALRLIEALEK